MTKYQLLTITYENNILKNSFLRISQQVTGIVQISKRHFLSSIPTYPVSNQILKIYPSIKLSTTSLLLDQWAIMSTFFYDYIQYVRRVPLNAIMTPWHCVQQKWKHARKIIIRKRNFTSPHHCVERYLLIKENHRLPPFPFFNEKDIDKTVVRTRDFSFRKSLSIR